MPLIESGDNLVAVDGGLMVPDPNVLCQRAP